MEKAKHLFLFAGEQSGDLLGGRLLSALKQQQPQIHCTGVGGPAMREAGLKCILPMEAFTVMGFTDVVRALPKLYQHFRHIRTTILKERPDAVLLIDYPGFNLRLAKALRKRGYQGKIIQYVCPSIWAWKKGRMRTLIETLDLLLPLFPFEEKLFINTSLRAPYLGNPIAERVETHTYHINKLPNLSKKTPLLALFPGSRKQEILRNLPAQLAAAKKYTNHLPKTEIALSCSQETHRHLIEQVIREHWGAAPLPIIPSALTYELMHVAHLALATSGTITLELALHSCPTVMTYAISRSNYFLAKYLLRLRLPHYCITNILCEKEIFPEKTGIHLSPEDIFSSLLSFSTKTMERERCLQECAKLKKTLTRDNPIQATAREIEKQMF